MTPNPDTGPRTTAGSNPAASPDRAASAAAGRSMPAVAVRVPGPLRALTDGAGELEVEGATVAAVLERLVADYPGLRRHLLADGGPATEVRDYVNVFVNDDDVRTLDGVATTVGPEDTITIVPSIAGG